MASAPAPSPLARLPTLVRSAAVFTAVVLAGCTQNPTTGTETPPEPTSTSTPTTTIGNPAEATFGPPVLLGQIADTAITESSGLVASRRNPGRLWTHNDSGNDPLLFCLEPDGRSCGTWTVGAARNVDWEDLAAGPGPEPGEPYLFVGDIGDNPTSRSNVSVYRVPEPSVPASPVPTTTETATRIDLTYPDGPHDAETLMVHPTTGNIYLATKEQGVASVYRAPQSGGTMALVGTVTLGLLGIATGGDISEDGTAAVLSSPLAGFELALDPAAADASDFDRIWAGEPAVFDLPALGQLEAIAYRLDGFALVVTSEGASSPLVEIPRS